MALDLSLPQGARLMAETVTDPGGYAVPVAPWNEQSGIPAIMTEGRVVRQAWRIDASDLTVLQILSPLRDQIESAGYRVVFGCATRACGGFDFRFEAEVMPAPEMYVDLTAFRFLSAVGPSGDYLTLLVSRSDAAGFVQIIRTGSGDAAPPVTVTDDAPELTSPPKPLPENTGEIATLLERQGHVVLRDLSFETGSSSLGDGSVASLDALASYLKARPGRQIVFVGHTDATGSLQANIALSRRRAQAAVVYLRKEGVPAGQISADGVGYLAPITTNLTAVGREENRRVEAVLISTE